MPAGPLIAIVDDDDSMRSAVVALIRSAGYEARSFASAEEFLGCGAVAELCVHHHGYSDAGHERHRTQTTPLDYPMPGAGHHDHGAPHADLEGRALASGAVCFLRKPFEADALIHCLEDALKS